MDLESNIFITKGFNNYLIDGIKEQIQLISTKFLNEAKESTELWTSFLNKAKESTESTELWGSRDIYNEQQNAFYLINILASFTAKIIHLLGNPRDNYQIDNLSIPMIKDTLNFYMDKYLNQ